MTNQITIEQALELVEFVHGPEGWRVKHVGGNVWGNVWGGVCGDVRGKVLGTIKGRKWRFVETPKEKLQRLIHEGAGKAQLLEALEQLEESND